MAPVCPAKGSRRLRRSLRAFLSYPSSPSIPFFHRGGRLACRNHFYWMRLVELVSVPAANPAICAGGFFAGNSWIYNYLDLTPTGVWFNYYADEFKGIYKEAVEVKDSTGTQLDQYWENGPQFTGWGKIVGKYPDGTPAIVEGNSGKGWVILSGVHPEAPASWRTGMTFTTSVAVDNAYAETLVTAALNGTSLPHY